MGHSLQAIAILVKGVSRYFAVPLTAKIHEGIRYHCHDKRTLLDKLFETLATSLRRDGTFCFLYDQSPVKIYLIGKNKSPRHL